jgi:hypothetical protein
MPRPWLRRWSLWKVRVRGDWSNLAAFPKAAQIALRAPVPKLWRSEAVCSRLTPHPIRKEGGHGLAAAAGSAARVTTKMASP